MLKKKQWDEYAETYDMKRKKDIDYMNCIYAAVQRVSSAFQNNHIVLDVGCGTGIGTRQLVKMGRIVKMGGIALDISINSLQLPDLT
ncbi:MAG: class I SAM-dependent methyltransferase [Planctomycetaceae bacterium]|jgi:predicted TPR repeat methyltransferase|nr:class I SAM-dependent methyltransferase [Planctomycetaceae bacterium]